MDRRTFLAATASSALTSAAFAQKKETIKIVSSMPRTGSAKAQTDHIAFAIRLAIEEREKQLPFRVDYLDWDDATAARGHWDPEKEAGNARKAVEDRDVMAVIGPYNSGAAMVSMPILNEEGLVQVSPACTWAGLTRKPKNDLGRREPEVYRPSGKITFCRVCPHDDTQGPLTARFVAADLKAESVYVLDDNELYGKGVAKAVADECKALNVMVLGHESINNRAQSFRDLMMKVKKTAPGAVFFGGTTQTGGPQIAKDMRAEGLNCPLVVPDGCHEPAFIKAAGEENLKNCYATLGGIDVAELKGSGSEFVKRYKERWKKDPVAYSAYGYEAAAVVLEAIRAAGNKDREAIRQAVVSTKDFDKGVLGKWSFDENGDTTLQQLTVSKIEDGTFKSVKVFSAAEK
jgi:branched-chain amino acid transport system substrate-binding protein